MYFDYYFASLLFLVGIYVVVVIQWFDVGVAGAATALLLVCITDLQPGY